MYFLSRFSLTVVLALFLHPALHAETVAISSVVFNGYARERLPDGTFKPEVYTFGEGGTWTRPVDDPTMAKLKFTDIVQVVAKPLAKLNYRPALKTADIEILIVVFWGATQGSRDNRNLTGAMDQFTSASSAYNAAQGADQADQANANGPSPATAAAQHAYDSALWLMHMDNAARDRADNENARILGYTEALSRARFAPHMSFLQDAVAEISDNRYYVVLQAYDFKTAQQHKKLKPLWTTRLSVSESGAFVPALEKMLKSGAPYFGKDSDGLRRQREGRVDLAPLKIIEVDPAKK